MIDQAQIERYQTELAGCSDHVDTELLLDEVCKAAGMPDDLCEPDALNKWAEENESENFQELLEDILDKQETFC